MTQLRTFRLACLALGDQAPFLPGGFDRCAKLDCRARTLDAFLAELDAGGELPDAVLVFDGARAAAVLRRHDRCALIPLLVFGAPAAALPPGCDAWVASVTDAVAAIVFAGATGAPREPGPARDSERRARRFAVWMAYRGHADAADAAAFGLEAPHSLLAAWQAAGLVVADAERGWLATPRLSPSLQERNTMPTAVEVRARAPGRFTWPALLLVLFALVVTQGGWLLGPSADAEAAHRRSLAERLVLGTNLPLREVSGPAVQPIAEPETPPLDHAPAQAPARLLATASVLLVEETVTAAATGEWRHRRSQGGTFAAAELLGALIVTDALEQLTEAGARVETAMLVLAPRPGAHLEWLVPHCAMVQAGEPLLRFATGEVRLEVQLEESEWSAAHREPRAEAWLGSAADPWRPVTLLAETAQADGSVRLSFAYASDPVSGAYPERAEVRWSLAPL